MPDTYLIETGGLASLFASNVGLIGATAPLQWVVGDGQPLSVGELALIAATKQSDFNTTQATDDILEAILTLADGINEGGG